MLRGAAATSSRSSATSRSSRAEAAAAPCAACSRCSRPYHRRWRSSALRAHRAPGRRLLAGPALVAYGIDAGHAGQARRSRARPIGRLVYLVMAFAGLCRSAGPRSAGVARSARGSCATCATGSSAISCPSRSTSSRPRRPAGSSPGITSDIDAMQDLVPQGLVLFVQNVFLFIGAVVRDPRDVAGSSRSCVPDRRPAGVLRQPLVPARLEQGVPRGPRPHLAQPHHAPGGPGRACGWCRRSGASGRSPAGSGEPTRTSTTPTWRRCGSRRRTSRSSSTPAWPALR